MLFVLALPSFSISRCKKILRGGRRLGGANHAWPSLQILHTHAVSSDLTTSHLQHGVLLVLKEQHGSLQNNTHKSHPRAQVEIWKQPSAQSAKFQTSCEGRGDAPGIRLSIHKPTSMRDLHPFSSNDANYSPGKVWFGRSTVLTATISTRYPACIA